MIDTHCHIDLYDDPLRVAEDCETKRIKTIAVTHLPSHYLMAEQHLKAFKYVRPALGMHPMSVKDHKNEMAQFRSSAATATLIGEIGLDFSPAALSTKADQQESFASVLDALREKKRFITVHSRRAEDAVLAHLRDAGINPVVFHWFSGSRSQMIRILDAGHYLSINAAMIGTNKWQELIHLVPRERILTESDGPFAHFQGKPASPESVSAVNLWLAEKWSESSVVVEQRVQSNLDVLSDEVFPQV